MTESSVGSAAPLPPPSLRTIALIFLRLGFTAFGGPAAHIAMMQREFVELRGWITRQEFLDMLGAVNLIPGPNSTELAIHIGYRLGGRRGLLVAGACFIGPAFAIVLMLAWLYAAYGRTPDVTSILLGIKPVVLAVIAQAIWKLMPPVAKRWELALLACAVFVAGSLGINELLLLLGSGMLGIALRGRNGTIEKQTSANDDRGMPGTMNRSGGKKSLLFLGGSGFLAGILAAPTVAAIFLYFLYVGSVLYGSGYVLVAFLHDDLVSSLGWLTNRQLLDAVAVGQVTPGPVFTTATFIGYLLGGLPGSIAATVGIFLPSFLFVLLTGRYVTWMRSRPAAAGFLDGVNSGALGLIAVALVLLAQGTLVTPLSWGIVLVAACVLLLTKINPTWLILAGGVIGWVVR